LIKFHTISGARGLTGPKLVLTCVKKALGVDLYEPNASSSELARGGSGLMNEQFLLNRIKVVLSTMWAQLQRRQMAYGYMGYGAMYNMGTNFLVA
jgi:hypothetical protein